MSPDFLGLVVDSEKEKVWDRVHGWVIQVSKRGI
jgi:hypothetical protein